METKESAPPGKKRERSLPLDAGGRARCYNCGYRESGSVPGSAPMGNVGLTGAPAAGWPADCRYALTSNGN